MKKEEGIPLENITGREQEGLPADPPTFLQRRMQHILNDRPLAPAKTYRLKKVGDKRAAKIAALNASGSDSEIDLFFQSLRKGMTGKCLFCGGPTMKTDDEKFHFSLAHLLPKTIFKSVATNPDNIIELCFWENNCHGNFDTGMITWQFIADSKEWEIIREKLLNVLPLVAPEEQKHKLYSKLMDLVYR